MNRYLAIDVGGTFIKYGIFQENGDGELIDKEATKVNPEEFVFQLTEIIKRVNEKIKFNGVGISLPGFINVATGENNDFTVGENFTKYNLKKVLKENTGFNIAVENDANCVLLAEKWIGNARDTANFAVVTFGTGIGGGIMVNNTMLRGQSFAAGEFGIMNIGKSEDNELKYAGATSTLVNRVSIALDKEVDGKYIFDNIDRDSKIKNIYEKWIEEAALTISNIAIVIDPEKILIGGGISAQERFIEDLKAKVYKMYFHLENSMKIEKCKLENEAGMAGAIYNYLNELKNI